MSAIGMYNLLRRLEPARVQLAAHGIYANLQDLADIRIFMEHHVFAVLDFMSLLKALQRTCTCVDVPWVPTGSTRVRRLINEIVLEEESDEVEGGATSHYELYLAAMAEMGADSGPVESLTAALRAGVPVEVALRECGAPVGARAFVQSTFEMIRSDQPHIIAAAFTFGREEQIPSMFRTLVGALHESPQGNLSTFVTYLDRHIGLDEDHHAPMAVEMLAELCGDDPVKWDEAARAAIAALSARLSLWSAVVSEVSLARMGVPRHQAA